MTLTITPTSTITLINGQPARIWKGVSDRGVQCNVFVSLIGVPEGDQQDEFLGELLELDVVEVEGGVAIELKEFDA